jgi:hypothetical protein
MKREAGGSGVDKVRRFSSKQQTKEPSRKIGENMGGKKCG